MDSKRKLYNLCFKFLCYFSAFFAVFSLLTIIGSLICLSAYSFRVCNLNLPLSYNHVDISSYENEMDYYEAFLGDSINSFVENLPNNNLSKEEILDLINSNISNASLMVVKDHVDAGHKFAKIPIKYNKELSKVIGGNLDWSWRKNLFTNSNSFFADLAGLKLAVIGTLLIVLMVSIISIPIGILTAIYLVEFASKNRFTNFLEVLINNLASVPSIIFGLFGLSILINYIGFPHASALVAGIIMSILVLPMVIISSKNALLNVPRSIYNSSFVLGASKVQTIFYQVLPIAMPEIIAGSLVAILRAIGETAPLLLIGMVAFIANTPESIFDPISVIPVQIYQWISLPDKAFLSLATSAIIFLMLIILILNAIINFILASRRIKK